MAGLTEILTAHQPFHPVVPYNPTHDKLLQLDFTANNTVLTGETFNDTNKFTGYINSLLERSNSRYGIGGYIEHRKIYARSALFGEGASGANQPGGSFGPASGEARSVHLGIDIWGKPYTKIMAPLDGIVHSFAFNNAFGDYGATIILTHQLDGVIFHTLYGHLSLNSMKNLQPGDMVKRGDVFAEFGIPFENGQWPPHLHFQLITDLQGREGDYPGVCTAEEKESYAANCPDPDVILQMMQHATSQYEN